MAEHINSKVHVAALVQEEAEHAIAVCKYVYKAGRPPKASASKDSRAHQVHFLVDACIDHSNDVTDT